MPRHALAALAAAAALAALTAPTAGARAWPWPPRPAPSPTLVKRAILPADATAPAPFPGVVNTDPAPAPGSSQPVGGFSALIDAPGPRTFWAMPDNGFGNKANSRSFLLRLYKVRTDWKTARAGDGSVRILDVITLRDPDHRIPFKIVNDATSERLLTGGDFDIESIRLARDGTLWFGEEFGPFLVHADLTGRVLGAPIPLPGVKSPDYPPDYASANPGPANLASSNGFEGMAVSQDGRKLYPVLEGPPTTDPDQLRRYVYEFDLRTSSYTGRRRQYRLEKPGLLVSDFTLLHGTTFVALERDNNQGTAAEHKRAYVTDLRAVGPDGFLRKRLVLDELKIADPSGISEPARPGDVGIGDPFSMPYVTIEAVLPRPFGRLAIVNDTNFGSMGRNPALPDYSDFIVVRVPGLNRAP